MPFFSLEAFSKHYIHFGILWYTPVPYVSKWYSKKTSIILVQVISIACLDITTVRQARVSSHVYILNSNLEFSATCVYYCCI